MKWKHRIFHPHRWFRRESIGVAISGGGCKSIYALGAFRRLTEFGLKVDVWAGTSAGASMAVALAVDKAREVMATFLALTAVNEKNMYLSRLIMGRTPFPHETMYRNTIRQNISWEEFTEKVREIIIPVAKVPPGKLSRVHENIKVFYDLSRAYIMDLELVEAGKPEHYLKEAAYRLGLEEYAFTKKDIRDKRHLEDIILASSSLPPLVRFQKIDDRRYLDGGIFSNLPIQFLRKNDYRLGIVYRKNDLVNYKGYLRHAGTWIFVPTKDVAIPNWEYSRPDLVEEVYHAGYTDAERFADEIRFLL